MKFILHLLLFLPVFGQLLRLPLFDRMGIMPSDLVALIILGVWIFQKFKSKTSFFPKQAFHTQLFWPALIFFGWALVSLLLNINFLGLNGSESFQAFGYFIRYLSYFLLIFIFLDFLQKEKKETWTLKHSLYLSSFFIAILGFLQLKFFPSFFDLRLNEQGWDPHIGRLLSTWFDPNLLGGFFVLVMSFLAGDIGGNIKGISNPPDKGDLGGLINTINSKPLSLPLSGEQTAALKNTSNKIISNWILIPLFTILLIALALTFSRSSYLAFIVAGFIFAFFAEKRLLIIGAIAITLLVSVSDRAQERVTNAIQSAQALFTESEKSLDATARLRVQSWQVGWKIFQENPITGVGFNTLKTVQKKEWAFMTKSHAGSGIDASILTVMATTGIIGIIAFLWIWFQILWISFKKFRLHNDYFALGIFSGILGLFAHAIFVNTLFFNLLLPSLFLGVALVLRKEK